MQNLYLSNISQVKSNFQHEKEDFCIRKINFYFVSLGRDIQKQKIVQVPAFPIIFVTEIRITKKYFSFVFKPKFLIGKTSYIIINKIETKFVMVSHYLTNRYIKNSFRNDKRSHLVWIDLINFYF